MSVSSNSRKESTESNAAQQMHSTMGIHPDLAQLNDKNLENDLPSRVAGSNDTDVPGEDTQATALADESDETTDGMSKETIKEATEASWGTTSAHKHNAVITDDDATPPVQPTGSDKTLGHS